MPITIHELRCAFVDQAARFAESCGSRLDGGHIVHAMSLVAFDGENIVAAALCIEQPDMTRRLELGFTGSQAPDRSFMDKALMKLQSLGVRKCDIRTNGQPGRHDFWRLFYWFNPV